MTLPTNKTAPGRRGILRNRMYGLVVSVFVLAGCQSSLTTEITVESDGAGVVAELAFQGDVVNVLQKDPALREQLETKIAELVEDFSVKSPGELYVMRPSQGELQAAGGITGIGSIAVSRDGSIATVSVQTVDPAQLREAILASVAGQPDAQSLQQTMLTNTFLEVRITFPGSVIESNGGVIEGRTVRYRDSVDAWAEGTLVARGEGKTSGNERLVILVAVAGVILAAVAWRRRKGE